MFSTELINIWNTIVNINLISKLHGKEVKKGQAKDLSALEIFLFLNSIWKNTVKYFNITPQMYFVFSQLTCHHAQKSLVETAEGHSLEFFCDWTPV